MIGYPVTASMRMTAGETSRKASRRSDRASSLPPLVAVGAAVAGAVSTVAVTG
jgi:hypothetical protein